MVILRRSHTSLLEREVVLALLMVDDLDDAYPKKTTSGASCTIDTRGFIPMTSGSGSLPRACVVLCIKRERDVSGVVAVLRCDADDCCEELCCRAAAECGGRCLAAAAALLLLSCA